MCAGTRPVGPARYIHQIYDWHKEYVQQCPLLSSSGKASVHSAPSKLCACARAHGLWGQRAIFIKSTTGTKSTYNNVPFSLALVRQVYTVLPLSCAHVRGHTTCGASALSSSNL